MTQHLFAPREILVSYLDKLPGVDYTYRDNVVKCFCLKPDSKPNPLLVSVRRVSPSANQLKIDQALLFTRLTQLRSKNETDIGWMAGVKRLLLDRTPS